MTEEEREELINAYLDSLDLRQKDVEKQISEDKELKQTADAINFMEKVQSGEIDIELENVSQEENTKIKDKINSIVNK